MVLEYSSRVSLWQGNWHLQPQYNTPIKGVWSTLVVSIYGKIIGHLQPHYNSPIEGVWSTLELSLDGKIIGHL